MISSVATSSRVAAVRALRLAIVACALVCAAVTSTSDARAQAARTTEEATPIELKDVGITEKLDSQVPLDAQFKDENGNPVRLGDLFDGKRPTLLTFAYYSCPVLCSLILNSADDSLSKIGWTIGKEFDVVTISIDPRDTAEKARDKKASLLASYKHPEAGDLPAKGWHFLLGDETTIKRVTDAVGYRFKYDEEQKQYGHPASLIMLKPSGRVARYLYGLEYPPNDVKIGLLEASEGKSISTGEQIILFCYRYNATEGKYVLVANRIMKIGGAFFASLLGLFLAVMWRREKKRSASTHAAEDTRDTRDLPLDASIAPMENRT